MFEYSNFYNFDDSSDDEGNDDDDDDVTGGSVSELVLANGHVIGHRSLWKYFKQSFNPKTQIVLSKRQKQINQHRLKLTYY